MSHDDSTLGSSAARPGRWDFDALRAGATICLILAIPFSVLGLVVDGVNLLAYFGAVAGFIIGSGSAAWAQQRGTPLTHGLVTAIGTYVVAQAVFVVVRLITDRDVNWFGIVFTLSLVSFAGLVGGYLGSRLQAKGFVPSSRRSTQESG
ncbi:hypothetical protein [Ilumatobacter nonamiensis]|uniref:hypothetical protein n=1 Tax=Ilumatobacter nonamiensis TaxID=467093 RepID=UPI0011D1D857|nr:hypothetical protein [Ilumatobacter nonamiensis]